MWPVIILSALVLGLALANIISDYRKRSAWRYLTKVLTMLAIMAIVLLARTPESFPYRLWVLLGLGFSLVGDIVLMLPENRLMQGLISFLIAHLCYIVAFSFDTGFVSSAWLVGLLAVYGFFVFLRLQPHLGSMMLPVSLYVIVITAMAWRAGEHWLQLGGVTALWAFGGALLFVISDTALAFERFVGPYRIAKALVLGTYFAAQWLIALSV